MPAARMQVACVLLLLALGACAGLPPGAGFPRVASHNLVLPEETRTGRRIAAAGRLHDGQSGFRIVTLGVDGLLIRAEMIEAAERTLDVQYFIYRGDVTGRLVTAALVRAAARGVRVRVLVDDADTLGGDEQLLALDGVANAQVRVFNPFRYRGHVQALRIAEFLFNMRRLDYRMHNKLMIADGAVALMGGRNIGDQYFQVDPSSQLADDDVLAAGPVALELAASFDEYWNSGLAIPVAALTRSGTGAAARQPPPDPATWAEQIRSGQPYEGMLSGELQLTWAHVLVLADSPHKKQVVEGERRGQLMNPAVLAVAGATQSELLMINPYVIPASAELSLLSDLRRRQVQVRILTNSLEGAPGLFAQAGYMSIRRQLLEEGVELHESRALLGSTRGSGQGARISRYGNYALHAKLFVFDRRQVFIGSMNFDRRSQRLNTELGLIIDSPQLADETAARFAAMVQPRNAFAVKLQTAAPGQSARLQWQTEESGTALSYAREPARNVWQRIAARMLSLLPFGREQ